MRTEQEMLELILSFAQNDDNIRAAYMNGSKANPNIKKDDYQDYDVVFACHDIQRYCDDHAWIDTFGQIAILQEADQVEQTLYDANKRPDSYIFLILYKDDVRTDLCFKTINQALIEYGTDSLTILLMDKDHRFIDLGLPTDRDYWISKPTAFMVNTCINEFYWCLQNVGKGLARDQIPYALWMMNGPVREMLTKIIEWNIAKDHQYHIATGSHGKAFKELLSASRYERLLKTYCDGLIDNIWDSVFEMMSLFKELALEVCQEINLPFHEDEAQNLHEHLTRIRNKSSF